MKKGNSITVGLVIASVGVMALAFVPVLREVAVAWWLLGLAGLIVALVVRKKPHRGKARTAVISATAFVAADAAAIALVGAIAPTSARAAEVDELGGYSGAGHIGRLASELSELAPASAEMAIGDAQRIRYEPRSGLTMDWAAATAYDYESSTVVSVPLSGTDIPAMTKVSFLTSGGATSVTEMASGMVSATEAHFAMWQDGTLTKNVQLTEGSAEAQQSSIGTHGLDWNRLNNCLNSIGISWAVIAILGVACGAACATAVLCAPCLAAAAGFTTGTIAKCVSNAWS
ncbi:hypothetical protein AAEP80_05730 [Curtobacterium sp. L3-7]|uniref:hypothetical protein n=1 Tax=Curtobacterium sp. L3-7 TaxID=3138787 RepID=UPI003B518789